MTDDNPYHVNATKTSILILETLGADGPLGVTALASRINISKGTTHNHLTTLHRLGYVKKAGNEYDLTLRMLAVGERTRNKQLLFRVSKSYLHNLAQTASEYAALYVEEEGRGTTVYHSVRSGQWEPPLVDGEQSPLHATAAGKAILAQLPDARIDEIINRHGLTELTEQTITDRHTLFNQLQQVRDSGAAFSRAEQFESINAVAAPIRNNELAQKGAISVVGPADVLNGRYFEEDITGQVLSTAKRIEVDLRSA